MKKLIFFILLLPSLVLAKEYKVRITPCDKSSNCTKCYEQVDLTYRVDEKSKTVTVSGLDIKGPPIQEAIKECNVSNANNWSCSSAFFQIDVRGGKLNIINNPKGSLASSGKEVCRLR
jgi:hypothetical protein